MSGFALVAAVPSDMGFMQSHLRAQLAALTIGDTVKVLHENELIYVPIGSHRRPENPGKIDLDLKPAVSLAKMTSFESRMTTNDLRAPGRTPDSLEWPRRHVRFECLIRAAGIAQAPYGTLAMVICSRPATISASRRTGLGIKVVLA